MSTSFITISIADAAAKRLQRSRGVVAVEAALVLPILLLLTFALIEYGLYFQSAEYATNAARAGARIAVRADATATDVSAGVAALMNQAGLGSSGYTITLTPANFTTLNPGDNLTVRLTVPYTSFTGSPKWLPLPSTITASVSMAKEGP